MYFQFVKNAAAFSITFKSDLLPTIIFMGLKKQIFPKITFALKTISGIVKIFSLILINIQLVIYVYKNEY